MADRASEGTRCTARGVQAFRGENSIYGPGTVFFLYRVLLPHTLPDWGCIQCTRSPPSQHLTSMQTDTPPPALITKGPRVSLAMQPVCGQKQPLVSRHNWQHIHRITRAPILPPEQLHRTVAATAPAQGEKAQARAMAEVKPSLGRGCWRSKYTTTYELVTLIWSASGRCHHNECKTHAQKARRTTMR